MIEITVDYKDARVKKWETLTSGSVNVKIRFSFSPEWDGLIKTVCFDNGGDKLPSISLKDEEITIPVEAMAIPCESLKAGVYGERADGTLVIPTVYVHLGKVKLGAVKTGRPAAPPTPDWTTVIETEVKRAVAAAEDVQRRADAGEFKGERGPAGKDGADGRNGTDGKNGPQGVAGPAGPKGEQGAPGRDGTDGRNGTDGAPGAQGPPGKDGRDGVNGKDATVPHAVVYDAQSLTAAQQEQVRKNLGLGNLTDMSYTVLATW